MKKVLLILSLIISDFVYAQITGKFQLKISSQFYNGKVLFISAGANERYNKFEFNKNNVGEIRGNIMRIVLKEGTVCISGSLQYPHPLIFSAYGQTSNKGYSSFPYFIDPDDSLKISISDLSKNKKIQTKNNSNSEKEYKDLLKSLGNSIDTATGVVNNWQGKLEKMKQYIIQFPNSYVALWESVFDFSRVQGEDYEKLILENLNLFSKNIKATKTYMALEEDINKDFQLSIGRIFPDISLDSLMNLHAIVKENDLTLVEFWFSHCQPCIAQFPALKAIYDSYRGSKFEIVAISTDEEKDEANWKSTIKKYDLAWLQYLDKNGKQSEKLNINKFPSNFLVDKNGKIVKKDISPEELTLFLKGTLN
ncbi:MAG: TlpA family protein disulfide reductase [Bacteroidetes bacterium]|nr:TlpA family protein disulfide reductase [Bacteroidota bacterium]